MVAGSKLKTVCEWLDTRFLSKVLLPVRTRCGLDMRDGQQQSAGRDYHSLRQCSLHSTTYKRAAASCVLCVAALLMIIILFPCRRRSSLSSVRWRRTRAMSLATKLSRIRTQSQRRTTTGFVWPVPMMCANVSHVSIHGYHFSGISGNLEMSENSANVGEKSGEKAQSQERSSNLCSQWNVIVAAQQLVRQIAELKSVK